MILLLLLAEPSLSACQEISSIDEDDIEDIGDATDEDSKELPTGTFEQLNIR